MSTLKASRSVCPASKCRNECSEVGFTNSRYGNKEATREVALFHLLHLKLLEKMTLNIQIFQPLPQKVHMPSGWQYEIPLLTTFPFHS